MNGGRLSNDAAFLIGVEELKAQLAADAPDAQAAERALTRILIRYPEEGEALAASWRRSESAVCTQLLADLEQQHAEEND